MRENNLTDGIFNHSIPPEYQWVLFERIRIATAVLPAVYTHWINHPNVIRFENGEELRNYPFEVIAMDIADKLIVEAVVRTKNELKSNELD